jgi:putative hydrolase of the HAD superfamily
MSSRYIKNVVFDIGNVLVKWSPLEIVRRTFGDNCNDTKLVQLIFKSDLWRQLNIGYLTEKKASEEYCQALQFDRSQVDLLFHHIKDSQDLIDGMVELVKRLNKSGYPIFALTDNVKEIVAYLRNRYSFWQYFQGAIVSAEVKCLKPNSEIFFHLLNQFELEAPETVFIDDYPSNIKGAREMGFVALEFKDAKQCECDLLALGLHF